MFDADDRGGVPLPHTAVDNHTVLNAPSYSDYDALFIDPESITRAARELLDGEREFTAHDGRPVVNGASTAAASGAADQLQRRGEEATRLLDRGGLVIVVGRPNATQSGIVGFEGCDRYSWLPAPEGAAWGPPFLRPADGATIRIAEDEHPFSNLLRNYRTDMTYRARFDDRRVAQLEGARIVARGGSDVPISIDMPVLGGRVIVVPVFKPVTGPVRARLAQAVVDAAAGVLSGRAGEQAPGWAKGIALPGLEQIEAELEDAETAAASAREQAEGVRERFEAIAKHRKLLWASGADFSDAVQEALGLLGFGTLSKPGAPLEVESDGAPAFVEVESSRDTIAEWPYVRLQRRLEKRLLDTKERLPGLIVVNGQRLLQPGSREEPIAETLRIACENYGYALITGETLLALVQRALATESEGALEAIRRRLLRGAGLIDTETALGEGEAEPKKDAGPIF